MLKVSLSFGGLTKKAPIVNTTTSSTTIFSSGNEDDFIEGKKKR
jgi:hypothetical protein